AVDLPGGGENRVVHAGGGNRGLQALLIGLGIGELRGIGPLQAGIMLLPGAVEQGSQAVGSAQPEVVAALRADTQAGSKVLVVDDLRARRALHPESLGNAALVVPGL